VSKIPVEQLGLGLAPEEPERAGEAREPRKKSRSRTEHLHLTPEWRERRDALIARSPICEWCGREFGGKVVASVHHTGGDYRPSIGVGDEEAYLAMRDDEVAVICRGCHFFWHKHGLKPGDHELTCSCGKWKEPQFDLCLSCWMASGEAKGV
jgi:hypothetical protein